MTRWPSAWLAALSFALPAAADDLLCEFMAGEPGMTFEFLNPRAEFKQAPRSAIGGTAGVKNPLGTRGITKANFGINYAFDIKSASIGQGYCIAISSIDFQMGYRTLEVLIDEKYKPGSCEYNAVRKHEDEHVIIYQDTLATYIPLIRDEVRIAGMNLRPMWVKNVDKASIDGAINLAVWGNEKISKLVEKMQAEWEEKNALHDSEEEYLAVSAKCKGW